VRDRLRETGRETKEKTQKDVRHLVIPAIQLRQSMPIDLCCECACAMAVEKHLEHCALNPPRIEQRKSRSGVHNVFFQTARSFAHAMPAVAKSRNLLWGHQVCGFRQKKPGDHQRVVTSRPHVFQKKCPWCSETCCTDI